MGVGMNEHIRRDDGQDTSSGDDKTTPELVAAVTVLDARRLGVMVRSNEPLTEYVQRLRECFNNRHIYTDIRFYFSEGTYIVSPEGSIRVDDGQTKRATAEQAQFMREFEQAWAEGQTNQDLESDGTGDEPQLINVGDVKEE